MKDLLPGAAIALSAHATAFCVFGTVALTLPASPQGRMFVAATLAVLADVLVTLVLLGGAVEVRRTRPALGTGLAVGWAVGALGMAAFVVLVIIGTSDWSGHCPCEPPIDFG